MARRRSKIWIPKSVNRIKSIIALFIETHPAGLAVLTGRCRWPDPEEMHEMIAFSRPHYDTGVPIQGGQQVYQAQRKIETFESEKVLFDVLNRYGGPERIKEVMQEYAQAYPDKWQILQDVGNVGRPGAKSLEAIAGKHHMDIKTLRNTRDRIIEEIAMGIVFWGEDFRLL